MIELINFLREYVMTASRTFFLYGLFFSSVAVLFWGMLPIALKLSTHFSDPITLTWLRFFVAAFVLGLWQWHRGKLVQFKALTRKDWGYLLAAGSFLIVNYTTFVWSLSFLLPGSAQLSFQTAPIFLTLGGLFFLKEKINWQQCFFFVFIVVGILIFFHPVFHQNNQSSVWVGFIIVQLSAVAWSMYALLQKSLFSRLDPSNILFAIYIYATFVMLPFSDPSRLLTISTQDSMIALFCCINTLIAYGSFAQAMRYWQTVQVSASIALTPIASYILTEVCVINLWWSDSIYSSHADSFSLFGMLLVIVSAIAIQFISSSVQRKKKVLQTT
ncbi:DMT family transporter [Marinomonas algicola]|uniref:DMT family transporter n=1 Tax=Marinomonas algicola TaxID=2773454 RepID=UPI001EFF0EB7|nr:DMT family transporter [Marinomonas algicola]